MGLTRVKVRENGEKQMYTWCSVWREGILVLRLDIGRNKCTRGALFGGRGDASKAALMKAEV